MGSSADQYTIASKPSCTKSFLNQFQEKMKLNELQPYIFTSRKSLEQGKWMKIRVFKVKLRQVKLDIESWHIVWRSPELSKIVSCDTNKEVSISRHCRIKYFFNSVCMIRHRLSAQLREKTTRRDKISNFLEGRYVSESKPA